MFYVKKWKEILSVHRDHNELMDVGVTPHRGIA
jgi:hypothetical protein